MVLENIFFDTETTDINPGQIGQLSYIIEGSSGVLNAGNLFFKVDKVSEGAEKVHGFSAQDFEKLSGGLTFKDRLDEVYSAFNGRRLVAHNVGFDIKFISSELWRCGISFKPLESQCTMEFFKNVLLIPNRYKKYGQYKNPKLSEVVDYYNINNDKLRAYTEQLFGNQGDIQGLHDSRFDTTAMYVVTNIYREKMNGLRDWHNIFIN